ncbi:MAG: hypothetical protein Q9157_002005 [Trypethelium eluteriae]
MLLTKDNTPYIDFPSILVPTDIISSGSMVDNAVSRNFTKEDTAARSFARLPSVIYSIFGLQSSSPPILRCRNATQTSIVQQ